MANEARKSGSGSRHVRDVMTPNPHCAKEKDSLIEVARIMRDQDTGVVPVVDNNNKVIGLVTDRDIVVRCIADGKNPNDAKVTDVMTKSVRKVQEDATINEVITLMKGSEIRRVPVVDGNDKIVGIVSIGDIASEGENRGKVGDAIEDISQAAPNN